MANKKLIKAIPTKYKGVTFRSVLEARWAVYLDLMGYNWEYEKEGYTDGKNSYLPDFLVDRKFFLEVKPDLPLSVKDSDKIKMASHVKPIFVTRGYPSIHPLMSFIDGYSCPDGVLLCGSMRIKYGSIFYTSDVSTEYFSQEHELAEESMSYDLIYNKERKL